VAIEVIVDIDDCTVPESGCFSAGAPVTIATAESLAESQTVFGRHHVVKHRVDCAGKEVETPCNICTLVILLLLHLLTST
jgi:hypothetical protein